MGAYESFFRPLAFSLDPEIAHNLGLWAVEAGLVGASRVVDHRLTQNLFGLTFENPIGLAAGLDKNGVAVNQWEDVGFGFCEVGTITLHPQTGNPKPRLFRIPEDRAIINRMGFNNLGAAAAAHRLKAASPIIPLGINLGKSKVTELEHAPEDYQQSFRLLHRLGDYFVINVSSPNTPGLRSLQDKSHLKEIIVAMQEVDLSRPIFIKIAPDLEWEAIDEIVGLADEQRLTGIIATNTTLSRTGLTHDPLQSGGLSGAPLKQRSQDVMKHLGRHAPSNLVLIGVGGLFSAADVWERIAAGAHLVQLYTGWIYGGPGLVPRIVRDLGLAMDVVGLDQIKSLRGSGLPMPEIAP